VGSQGERNCDSGNEFVGRSANLNHVIREKVGLRNSITDYIKTRISDNRRRKEVMEWKSPGTEEKRKQRIGPMEGIQDPVREESGRTVDG
jgi:hypothetical protein